MPTSFVLRQSSSAEISDVLRVFAQPPVISLNASAPFLRAGFGWLRI